MAFMTPEVNGARQELPCLESPEINGARQEVAAVEKYVDGAWQEVWSNKKRMLELIRSAYYSTVGAVYDSSKEIGFSLVCTQKHDTVEKFACYAEGEFVNPTIQFEYTGGLSYLNTNNNQIMYEANGSMRIYTRTVNGEESYTSYLETADGNTSVGSKDGMESGTYSTTLNGTFDRIGIEISLLIASATYYSDLLGVMQITDLYIGGESYLLDKSCIY